MVTENSDGVWTSFFWSDNRARLCAWCGLCRQGDAAFAWARKIEAKGEGGSRKEATSRRNRLGSLARLGGASLVSVVESPDFRNRYDATLFRLLNGSRPGRIFGQGQVRPRAFVVDKITLQGSAQRSLAPHDDVVQAFAPDRTLSLAKTSNVPF